MKPSTENTAAGKNFWVVVIIGRVKPGKVVRGVSCLRAGTLL